MLISAMTTASNLIDGTSWLASQRNTAVFSIEKPSSKRKLSRTRSLGRPTLRPSSEPRYKFHSTPSDSRASTDFVLLMIQWFVVSHAERKLRMIIRIQLSSQPELTTSNALALSTVQVLSSTEPSPTEPPRTSPILPTSVLSSSTRRSHTVGSAAQQPTAWSILSRTSWISTSTRPKSQVETRVWTTLLPSTSTFLKLLSVRRTVFCFPVDCLTSLLQFSPSRARLFHSGKPP